MNIVKGVLNGQEFTNFEWKYHTPGGDIRYLLSNVFPLRNSEDRIVGGVSATIDLTERHLVEERLQSVLEGARCIFWDALVQVKENRDVNEYKYEWTYRLWNESAAQQIFPVDTADRDYVTAWLDARLPADGDVARIISMEAFEQGRSNYINEFRCRDRYGEMHWQREDVQVKPLGPGKWQLIGVCTDMTARKEAEGRLYSVLMGVRCIVWDAVVEETDEAPYLHWAMQLWNEAAAQQVLPLDTTRTDYISAWMKSRDDDQPQLDKNSSLALRWGLPGYTQEFRCRDRFGVLHWLQEDARVQPLERGRWRVIGVCTDITAHKEAEGRLQSLTKDLERSNASLQDFASIASHDLKEPLRKIHTFGGMLARKEDSLSEEARGYLERMLAAATRMQSLIDGLLSYSRITTRGNAFAPTDLNEVIKGVLVDLEVRIQETGATVQVSPLPTVMADGLQMRQLFQNLIGNALKFHRDDEPCRVCIGYASLEGRHVITITDNGIGFAAKEAERIFEVFERLDGSGREGTGIGLAICRRIAERHGGTLTATGTPGVGATFTLTL
jgi:signal transduction histidine kinase